MVLTEEKWDDVTKEKGKGNKEKVEETTKNWRNNNFLGRTKSKEVKA